jgi:hypothetical protein
VGFGRVSLPEIGFGVSRGRVWHLEGAAREGQTPPKRNRKSIEGNKNPAKTHISRMRILLFKRRGKLKPCPSAKKLVLNIGKKKNPKNTAAEVGTKLKKKFQLFSRDLRCSFTFRS